MSYGQYDMDHTIWLISCIENFGILFLLFEDIFDEFSSLSAMNLNKDKAEENSSVLKI